MKSLIAATCMTALLASQATATVYYEPEPQPEPETPIEQPQPDPPVVTPEQPPVDPTPTPAPPQVASGGGNADIVAALVAIVGIAILMNRRAEPDLSTPRPQVRPQTCLNKRGVIVVCGD